MQTKTKKIRIGTFFNNLKIMFKPNKPIFSKENNQANQN